jgi:superfamily II RNA helicase
VTEEVEAAPLERRLPAPEQEASADELLSAFLSYVEELGLELYPAQEEAIVEVFSAHNVILNTPTGSGKSLVALAACFAALATGARAFYTAPIKALVNEKFLATCRALGANHVGMMTGDASVNRDAPIICCTAEILSNLALREGARADVDWVVMDEFHYYSDRDRGVAWQVPLLTLPQARFVLMSATLGDTTRFELELTESTGAETTLVKSSDRPVPLDFSYVETPLHETVLELTRAGKTPIYIVHFSQRAACEQAQKLTSWDYLSKDEKLRLRGELKGRRLDSHFGRELGRYLPHGIGVHHAGMLPKYRLLVEKLAQLGYLKIICGTDTLGVGINIPLRTVLFTQLCKYDGRRTQVLSVRDFQQIAGRAGRRGYDTRGSVVVQAPEHVIQNLALKSKAAGDPKKLRKLHLKKPPDRGYAAWDARTLERLRTSEPEPLVSRFQVNHGLLLNVLSRTDEDGCRAMKRLVRDCHDDARRQRAHRKTAMMLFRSLVDAQIVALTGEGVRVNADLQQDFSLHQALSLYAVEVIDALSQEDRDYALTVLTLVEAILENPWAVLRQQVATLKTRRMAELKAAGVEYEERIAELEQVDFPKPEQELIHETFDAFSAHHPWVLGDNIHPKSIARDMYELGLSFNAYVKEYGLERAEGVLLRYLSEVYRTLERTVPEPAQTAEVCDLIDWLGAELKRVDASLLDEWERLAHPERLAVEQPSDEPEEWDVTSDQRAFTALVRNAVWRVVQALGRRDYERTSSVLRDLARDAPWTPDALRDEFASYWSEYDTLRTDPPARSPRYLQVEPVDTVWRLRQVLVDPNDDVGWALELEVDLAASREAGQPVVRLLRVLQG